MNRTITQLAELFGAPENTVRQALHRARADEGRPEPVDSIAGAGLYDTPEFSDWWYSRPTPGRPSNVPDESPRWPAHHVALAEMLWRWLQATDKDSTNDAEKIVGRRTRSGREFGKVLRLAATHQDRQDEPAVTIALETLEGPTEAARAFAVSVYRRLLHFTFPSDLRDTV